jgi:hypothetical protein
MHKYAYAQDDPVDLTDPTGLNSLKELLIVVAVIAVVANILLTVYKGIKHKSSAGAIALEVSQNLAVFVAIGGAPFVGAGLATFAAIVLFIQLIYSLIELARAWPHMDTHDKVLTVLIALTYAVFGASAISLKGITSTAPGTTASPLDWSIKAEGETRASHVKLHEANDVTKVEHGVFYGDSVLVINEVWNTKGSASPVLRDYARGTDTWILERPNAGYRGGMRGQGENLDFVTIITRINSNQLITGFPSGRGLKVKASETVLANQ